MGLSDNLFKRIENKTNVDKETIISLANKLQKGDMKNKDTLKEVINTLSKMTGKEVSEEQENKIIKAVLENRIPDNIEKYYE